MNRNTLTRIILAATLVVIALPASARQVNVSPSERAHYWILTNRTVDAMVPNSGVNLDKPGCAAVSYDIGSDGVTRNIKIRKVVPAGDLGVVAKSVIQGFRYSPSSRNPNQIPVHTYYIVPFNLPADPAARQRITHACDLPGFDRTG
jgi:hypothetical protein